MDRSWDKTWRKKIEKGDKLHFTLFDPDDGKPELVARNAKMALLGRTNAIMVGGSTVQSRNLVFKTVKAVRSAIGSQIPIILFPNSSEAVCEGADGIFFMTLLNSRNLKFLIGEQLKGASLVEKFGLEAISVGYIVISTSKNPTTVEKIGNVDRITAKDIGKAIKYSLVAKYWGMKYIYLEAGSGAQRSVPNKMISAVKNKTELTVIVGGGIRDPATALEKKKAGADIIVTTFNNRLVEIITAIDE
jgi:phosphoglycerol geranylgeranyltransferase